MISKEKIELINFISDKKTLSITYIEAMHLAKEIVQSLKIHDNITLNLFIESIKEDSHKNAKNYRTINSTFEKFISEINRKKIIFESSKEHLFLYSYITQKE